MLDTALGGRTTSRAREREDRRARRRRNVFDLLPTGRATVLRRRWREGEGRNGHNAAGEIEIKVGSVGIFNYRK